MFMPKQTVRYVTELTECIKVKSSDDADDSSEFVKFFPSFIWTVRDFTLERKIDGKDATEDEYLEFALKLKTGTSKKVADYNLPRECIQKFFPSRTCFTFPFPTAPENVSRLESLDPADLSSDFLEVTDRFCKFVFNKSHVKKLKDGITVTGRVLGLLAVTYVDTISSGAVPCLENAVIAMAMFENEAAVKEGLEVYQSGMEKLKDSFPLELKDVSSEHQRLSSMATQTFIKRSFRDTDGKYLKSLEENINKLFDGFLCQNEQASKRRCEDLLSSLSEPMRENFRKGFYTKPGGYDLFCKDWEDIVKNYNNQTNKQVKAEEVLEEFLKNKSVESEAILQADKKLTEKEKKIKKEIEKAALLQQENKAKEEKLRQLEEKMEAEKQSNEERIKEMEKKIYEELRLQREEAERAMDSKLREQADLLEKGFKEKADRMTQEMEEFNNAKRRREEFMDMLIQQHKQMEAIQPEQHGENLVCLLHRQRRKQMETVLQRQHREIMENINKLFDGYRCQNRQASMRQCEDFLSFLSALMTENLKKGFYTKPGGYDLFRKDLEDIMKNYYSQANKEVKAEEVLEEFLEQKYVESELILQADKKLTMKDKKIKEETEKAALLQQEIKAKEEKQRQLEQKMKAERRSNEERMRHMKEKMDEELRLQREEADRAMDSKLREQAALLEKGFKDKANRMSQEMEEFKRKNAEAESNRAKEFAVMLENSNRIHEEFMDMLKQQQQLEKKMESERQSNKERMRQLMEKMNEELRLQREEAERAMDSKLREQAALLEKGFKDMADMMSQELEEFKRQNSEAESNRAREFAVMLENSNKRHEETMAMMLQQQQQLKKKMEAERQSNKERVRQLMEKMDEELRLQREEAQHAVDSKLREQADLLEKGFKDMADMICREMEEFKRQNAEAESSKIREIAVMLENAERRREEFMDILMQQCEQIEAIQPQCCMM